MDDLSTDQPSAHLDSDQPRSRGNGLVKALIIGLVLVVVAAIAVGAYLILQDDEPSGDSRALASSGVPSDAWDTWANFFTGGEEDVEVDFSDDVDADLVDDTDTDLVDGGDAGYDETATYPDVLTDLDALTAVPGETFVDDYEGLVAGKDFSPGIYIAPDAIPEVPDDFTYCFWSVQEPTTDSEYGFRVWGTTDGSTTMLLAPEGYTVYAASSCGTWEAVDPATVFDEPASTTIGSDVSIGGYHVKPGLYLSVDPVANASTCFVSVNPNFGFESYDVWGRYFEGRGGTMRFEIEKGDYVQASGCPQFEWADPETAYSLDVGATSIDSGTWLAGVDVQPGTYRGRHDPDPELGFCHAAVYEGEAFGGHVVAVDEGFYTPGDEEPATVTVELSQAIRVSGCGPWELVEP